MADLIAYTDLALYLQIGTGQTLTFTVAEQTVATLCCTAASDAIKSSTNRTFEIQGSASDRYFTAQTAYSSALGVLGQYYPWPGVFPFTALTTGLPAPLLMVDDFFLVNQTIGNITVTDRTTLTTYTPLYTYPYNADSKGWPSMGLVFAPGTALSNAEGQLKVNMKWGYPALPPTVVEAALIQASRYFKRQGAPSGDTSGAMQFNNLTRFPRLDSDVEQMCAAARRYWGAA